MKALTLWQPWASAIAWGLKRFETRSWKTDYLGYLAIHAAKRWSPEQQLFAAEPLLKPFVGSEKLPLGAVVCIVELQGCLPTQEVLQALYAVDGRGRSTRAVYEELLGDYSFGRWAWKLELVEVFDEPIPARGHQGLWDWDVPEGLVLHA